MAKRIQTKPSGEDGNGAYGQDAGRAVAKLDGGLIRVSVRLTGVTPLLMNAMSQEALLALYTKQKPSKTAERPAPKEAADSKVYRLADGRPCVPPKNLFACLRGAGRYIRADGKRQISTATSTMLPGMLTIEDVSLPLYAPGTNDAARYEVDIQQGVNPNGGEAVCIIRPRFDAWEIRCTFEIDRQEMPLSMARQLVDVAGKRIGLGDGRPECGLTFGRFGISLWEAIVERAAA